MTPGQADLVRRIYAWPNREMSDMTGNNLESGDSISDLRVRRAGDGQRREKVAYISGAFVSTAKVLGRAGMRSSTTVRR
jgi:hypothetical protein